MMLDLINRLIEWDRGRKFGCEFTDFLMILLVVLIVNMLPIIFSWNLNNRMLLGFTTIIFGIWLSNRRPPE